MVYLRMVRTFGPLILGCALLAWVLILRNQLADARQDLAYEADWRRNIAQIVQAPSEKHDTVRTYVRNIWAENETRKQTLQTISEVAQEAHERALAADAALKREQEQHSKAFAAARPVIVTLEDRKPSGDAAKDCGVIEEDSKAAWKGWRR